MQFGIVGSGSWATALAKILTDNGHAIHWSVRSEEIVQHLLTRKHNPHYLRSVSFDTRLLTLYTDPGAMMSQIDCLIIAIPSAYVKASLQSLTSENLKGKFVLSAVKGILPDENMLLNEYLAHVYNFPLQQYCAVMGPCHAEEVAGEKLSYLTFSGLDEALASEIAAAFSCDYLNSIVNTDVIGVQYAAVLKNIYALGAGIAHGLEYGDNFLSVLIANSADEMAGFLRKVGIQHIEVGVHDSAAPVGKFHRKSPNYAASVYLGDLLVTCYSPFSRNRSFGNMIGKGYSVRSAQLEMNMVAEGYNASRCIYLLNQQIAAEMPIAEAVYRILWENVKPADGMKQIESTLV
ncbi:MAG TPA: NAD(P)H-dependent glycerol-3-phosphate dehydrogenase [Chitinophagaceae bacterium]|nr:NAD(P)H-dependent glycerol-3-phosphate dehydrogenase [Chitinophagaceae bacterium]